MPQVGFSDLIFPNKFTFCIKYNECLLALIKNSADVVEWSLGSQEEEGLPERKETTGFGISDRQEEGKCEQFT